MVVDMKRIFATALALSAFCTPVLAQPDLEPNSYAAMGCMKLRECTEGVTELKSVAQLNEYFDTTEFNLYKTEIDRMLDKFETRQELKSLLLNQTTSLVLIVAPTTLTPTCSS